MRTCNDDFAALGARVEAYTPDGSLGRRGLVTAALEDFEYTSVYACGAALDDAHLQPHQVDVLNAHATGTLIGDIAESQAAYQVFGPHIRTNSLKGALGHSMGASGALETIACVQMLQKQFLLPTQNLHNPDARCGALAYITAGTAGTADIILKNSFAIGGNNCSLLLRRVP